MNSIVPQLILKGAIAVFVFILAVYDQKCKRVPNRALLFLLPLALGHAASYMSGTANPAAVLSTALFGGLAGLICMLIPAIATNGGVGGGDIKLMTLLGLAFGPEGVIFIVLVAVITAGVFLLCIWPGTQRIAFVPFLCAGLLTFLPFNL